MGVSKAYYTGVPYNGIELPELSYAQTTDTMYLAHIDHEPAKLVRSGHTDWLWSSLSIGPSIAAPTGVSVNDVEPNTDAANSGDNYDPQPATYVVTSVNDDTGEESRASAEVTTSNDLTLKRNYNDLSWTSVVDASRYNLYKSNNSQFFGYIGTTKAASFRDVNIGPQLDRGPPQGFNPFAASGDYPAVVTLFEQRLIWGRTRNVPNGIWGSRVGASQLENMDRASPARPDDGFAMAIVSEKANPINQLMARTSLIAMTQNGIFRLNGGSDSAPLSATSQNAPREVGQGGSTLRPLQVDNVSFYTPSSGYTIRSVGYSFDVDGLKTNNVSIFSPHLFEGDRVVDWAYAAEPRSIIWAVLASGKLVAFTWEQEQGVWGWTRITSEGRFISVCVIREGEEDRPYFIVERTVGDDTKRFVERMSSWLWSDLSDACYMDCAVRGEFDTPRSTFTGLAHLEGRTDVAVNADGAFYRNLSVVDGSLTLPNEQTASKVIIGIPYNVFIETLPFRADLKGTGSNLGRGNQSDDVVLYLSNSGPVMVGSKATNARPVKQGLENWGSPFNLLDGPTAEITLEGVTGSEASVHIRQELPAPFTLLNIATGVILDP